MSQIRVNVHNREEDEEPATFSTVVTWTGQVQTSNPMVDMLSMLLGGPMQESLYDPTLWDPYDEEETIERNPEVKLNINVEEFEGNQELNCAICQDKFEKNEKVSTLECKHIFHEFCISEWGKWKAECPLCKKKIPVI